MLHVALAEAAEQIVIGLVPQPRQRVLDDAPIGAAGDGNAAERLGLRVRGHIGRRADDFLKRAVHRAPASAAGEHERAVDIEQNELSHSGNLA